MKPSRQAASSDAPRNAPGQDTLPAEYSAAAESQGAFPIVGIGASAGGLAALKRFFADVPKDSGLAFVIVVHLSPEHKSHLAELLQPQIDMPVRQVTETMALEKNHVYVIPPNANLDTIDTHLRLTALEKRRIERAPVDHFFRTLAKTHETEAIAVILTGTGSDGTLGLREIKQQGGLVVVQDPSDAEFDGMPQSAISTGMVDLVLPLSAIPRALLGYVRMRPRVRIPAEHSRLKEDQEQLLRMVFSLLRARTKRSFNQYKRSTILRRIMRRMQFSRTEEFSAYVELLRRNPEEVSKLADDLLITVTNFFRDPEVFQVIERVVVPELFDGRDADDPIRVWTVGCATGEEAYSIAMLLLEEAARREAPPPIQIFASDLHELSLHKARDAFFPGDIRSDVSPERLERFFEKEGDGYRIRKNVRELVVFAPHNLLGDPPFSHVDLITSRNLLIYLQREVQGEVIELFHYALKPHGTLILGTSETVESSDLFRLEDKGSCVYRKRNVHGPEPRLPVFPLTRVPLIVDSERASHNGEPTSMGMLHQELVEEFAPPSVRQPRRQDHSLLRPCRALYRPSRRRTYSECLQTRSQRIGNRVAGGDFHGAIDERSGAFQSNPHSTRWGDGFNYAPRPPRAEGQAGGFCAGRF